MPRNASGVCTVVFPDFQPGTPALSGQVDANNADFAQMLTDSLDRQGRGAMLAALDHGGFRATDVGTPVAGTDATTKDYVDGLTGVTRWYGGTSTGTANAQALSLTGFTLTEGARVRFIAGFTNTGAMTLNVQSTGATAVEKTTLAGPVALEGGEVFAGNIIEVVYDGTQYQLVNEPLRTLADDAAVYAATTGRVFTTGLIESAAALDTLTDAATIAVGWDTFINSEVTLTANRVLGNPTNGQPGTWRTVLVKGNDTTDRTLTFGSQYGGEVPSLTDIDNTKWYLVSIYCVTSTHFLAFAADGSAP